MYYSLKNTLEDQRVWLFNQKKKSEKTLTNPELQEKLKNKTQAVTV